MKTKQMGAVPAGEGVPYTEGYAEKPNPKTGVDPRDILPGGVEVMPVNITVAAGVTHEGDMGRLGKSE
jgi:hypothetical protein